MWEDGKRVLEKYFLRKKKEKKKDLTSSLLPYRHRQCHSMQLGAMYSNETLSALDSPDEC